MIRKACEDSDLVASLRQCCANSAARAAGAPFPAESTGIRKEFFIGASITELECTLVTEARVRLARLRL